MLEPRRVRKVLISPKDGFILTRALIMCPSFFWAPGLVFDDAALATSGFRTSHD